MGGEKETHKGEATRREGFTQYIDAEAVLHTSRLRRWHYLEGTGRHRRQPWHKTRQDDGQC